MISIKNLMVNLGDFLLQNINLDIEPGEYFIILDCLSRPGAVSPSFRGEEHCLRIEDEKVP